MIVFLSHFFYTIGLAQPRSERGDFPSLPPLPHPPLPFWVSALPFGVHALPTESHLDSSLGWPCPSLWPFPFSVALSLKTPSLRRAWLIIPLPLWQEQIGVLHREAFQSRASTASEHPTFEDPHNVPTFCLRKQTTKRRWSFLFLFKKRST